MLLRRIVYLLLALLIAFPSASKLSAKCVFHAIHISYTQAEWKNGAITGKATYFKDDYDKAVSVWSKKGLDKLSLSDQHYLRDAYFKGYFRAWVNGVATGLNMKITDVEEDGSSYIFHFTFELPSSPKMVTLDNRIIHTQYSDQTNLLQITVNGREINHAFTASEPTFRLRP